MSTPRVRFAPSPTGYLHVGGARTALFNWLEARRRGGTFVLRIEDTDATRSSEAMVDAILEGLTWLGMDWDEGPYFQSEGLERHRSEVQQLLERGAAFRDFSSPEELRRLRETDPAAALRYPRRFARELGSEEADRRAGEGEAHAVRLHVPSGETSWEDLAHGQSRFRNEDIEDLVILRTDGTPTYNLAVASDDADQRISLVIRGNDHISNTPKQILVHRALGRDVPEYAHVPMILGSDGKRLSKRHGATAVGDYEAEGILPESMVNFLALLGWSPGTDEEIMTRAELVDRFSLDRVLKKSAVFDLTKLLWLNGQHLNRRPAADLVELVLGELEVESRAAAIVARERYETDPEWVLALIDLLKQRARRTRDIAESMAVYLVDTITYEPDAVRKHWTKDPGWTLEIMRALGTSFATTAWNEVDLESALRGLAEKLGVGAGKLIHPLRVAVSGQAVSPGIFEVLRFLGKDRTLSRLEIAEERLRYLAENHS